MDHNHSGLDLPIKIDYHPPKWIDQLIAFSHLGAIFCIFLTNLQTSLKLVLMIGVIIKFILWFTSYISNRNETIRIFLDKEEQWLVVSSVKDPVSVTLKSACILFPELIFICLCDKKNTDYKFILTRHSASRESLRRLRVRLYHPRK
ncbi:MAG: hypothetical protein ACKVHQ_10060 [Gammaproteobacteria bacterium]|jgi:hypothetical protein